MIRLKTTAKAKDGLKFMAQPMHEGDLAAIEMEILELASDLRRFHAELLERGKAFSNPIERMW